MSDTNQKFSDNSCELGSDKNSTPVSPNPSQKLEQTILNLVTSVLGGSISRSLNNKSTNTVSKEEDPEEDIENSEDDNPEEDDLDSEGSSSETDEDQSHKLDTDNHNKAVENLFKLIDSHYNLVRSFSELLSDNQ
jgi:hypothetical protein